MRVAAAGLSETGLKRKNNEDAYLVNDELQLYVVADGMGGHQAGEVASQIAVSALQRRLQDLAANTASASNADPELSQAANKLLDAVRHANTEVVSAACADSAQKGMGCTVSAVWAAGNTIIAANVGDSPIYLIRHGAAQPLAQIHTLGREQEEAGMAPDSTPDPRAHHILTRALGRSEDVQPYVCEEPCSFGDKLLLCSDGLTNHVAPEEAAQIIQASPPAQAVQNLVALALERGGSDNVTAIVIAFSSKNIFVRGWRAVRDLAGQLFARNTYNYKA